MRVVIDSTEIIADFRFQGNGFRILLGSLSLLGIELLIPQIVIDEVQNKYVEEVSALEKRIHSISSQSARLLSIPLKPPLISANYEIISYNALFERTMHDNGIKVVPYPTSPHKDLVSRDLARRKPFDRKGKGYRDALIWESIIELLKSDQEPIAFITRNTSDFGDETNLHEDLCDDLLAIGASTETVQVFRSLNAFNHSVTLPQLDTLDDLREKMNHDCLPGFSLKSWLRDNLGNLHWDDSSLISPVKHDHASVHIKSIRDIDSVTVTSIHSLPSKRVVVSASVTVSGMLSITVTWDDYCQHKDVRDLIGYEEEPFGTSGMSYPITAIFILTLIFDEGTNEIVSAEVDAVEGGSRQSERWRLT